MISTFTALFDANVFFGARLRSLMIFMAMTKMFRARWSADIHGEWMRNLVAKRPDVTREQVERLRDLMDAAIMDAVVTGYEPLVTTLILPDPDDRHVLAAAIKGRADCIITFNRADFPDQALAPFDVHAVDPDQFLLDVQGLNPQEWAAAVWDDLHHYRQPPLSVEEYADSLAAAGVPRSAQAVREIALLLNGDRPLPLP